MDQARAACYSNFKYIGEGGFSIVYKAVFTPDPNNQDMVQEETTVAVKKIKMKARKARLSERLIRTISRKKSGRGPGNNALNFGDVKNELDICESLTDHNFVLDLLDSLFISKDEFWFVFEFTLGDLHHIVTDSKTLPQNQKRQRYLPIHLTRHLIAPIMLALKYMHESGFLHLDVKEDNILLTSRGVPKLSDFGAAKEFIDLPMKYNKKGPGGTFYYMSPEILRMSNYNTTTDTWGLAVTFISLVYGGRPFELQAKFTLDKLLEFLRDKAIEQDRASLRNSNRVTAQDRFYRLASLNFKPIKSLPDNDFNDFATFVKKLFILEYRYRPEIQELCNDPYILDVNQNWEASNLEDKKNIPSATDINGLSHSFNKNCADIVRLLCNTKG